MNFTKRGPLDNFEFWNLFNPPFENFLLLCYDDHVPHAEMWKFMKFGSNTPLNKKESKVNYLL